MKYLQHQAIIGDHDSAEDAVVSTQRIEQQLAKIERALAELGPTPTVKQQLTLQIERGYALLGLQHFEQAWQAARDALDQAITTDQWQPAVEACDILFQSEQPYSVRALAHGIWLGISFPIDPELSVAMLQHLVDETPDRSDGAAVAAAVANYIVDLRATGEQRENLQFFTNQLLGQVARRHSQVDEQEVFDFWVQQLELDQPDKFIPRMGKVLEVLVADDWWFDRDAVRAKIPD